MDKTSPSVRTVLGDVPVDTLGRISAHEHIAFTGGLGCIREPDFRLDDVDKVTADVAEFKVSGGGALVDAMPLAEGRSAQMLTDVALRTGVHVVGATGFHRLIYYTDRHWLYTYPVERIAELLIAEITEGMDENCHNGPDTYRTTARAGVIKLAAELHHIPDAMRRLFGAAGLAHAATHVPLLIHTDHGTAAHEVLDLLQQHGVDPARVLLSHMDRNPDPTYHQELAQRGAFLGYDWLARIRQRPDAVITDLVIAMADRGLADHVMLGMDLVRRAYWPAYGGGPGLRYLFGEFVPRMARAGVVEDVLDRVTRTNPARWLASA